MPETFCESCRIRPATTLIYFDENGPTFDVCDPCATAAAGYYGVIVPYDGGDAA